MTPSIAISIIEAIVEGAPALYTDLKSLFSSDTPPTAADFAALRAKVASETFTG
jgi:hypothetical protein